MLKTNILKYDIFKTYYWHGATLIGKYGMPQLQPTQFIPQNVISYNERNNVKSPQDYWVDFFIDDSLFESFWNNPNKNFEKLHQFKGVITPDYSMYPDLLPSQNIWNCTRNRVMAYYMQTNKFDIVPTASWCKKSDFDWCFDGLPERSSIAVTTNGCRSNPYSMQIFLDGIDALQKIKNPSHIIVCGRELSELKKIQ